VPTRLVVSERTHFSAGKPRKIKRKQILAPLMQQAYSRADRVVTVSHGVARDLVENVGVSRDHITVLHNPTIGPDFAKRMALPVEHPWFRPAQPPVILAVGRLAGQKDLPTLLEAFAIARRVRPLRLVLLGEKNPTAVRGSGSGTVGEFIDSLGIAGDVDLLGYDPNPIRYMARADLFVLSSRFEGFPNVLLEALASGCRVVSTDCPSGPFELLDGGRLGRLVPVGEPAAMAEAILASLDAPIDKEQLKARAALFDFEHSVAAYRNVLLGLPQRDTYPAPAEWQ
jgi:glycosyltransferase involved in cell wall biosynthesis